MITWPVDPTVYLGLVALYLGHAWLAGSVTDARRVHSLYFGMGLLVLWLALETPLDTISDYYLDTVHMFQHVLLGFVAPPLMILGLSPGMARRVMQVRFLRIITDPVPAQVIAGLVMVVWHLPALYDATLYVGWLHVLEHVMFIASGLVLYWPIFDATSASSSWQMSPAQRLVYMLIATLPQDGVALALIFSRVPFYEFYTHAPRLIAGYTPLIDQTIAGAVLMILGKVMLAAAALSVFFRWFGREQRADQEHLLQQAVAEDGT